jgi:hypothetical protein
MCEYIWKLKKLLYKKVNQINEIKEFYKSKLGINRIVLSAAGLLLSAGNAGMYKQV